ncbi:MAG: FIST C-terminal domain-containing protein [Alphaproteobacteria bacterium]|nr:FIST C-terminal domain-containing protein [Alphaproteobacteria bacterium]
MKESSDFKSAYAEGDGWANVAKHLLMQLSGPALGHRLGILYVTPELSRDLGSILAFLRETTRVPHWVGGAGFGVLGLTADGLAREARGKPAAGVMTMAIDSPAFRIFTFQGRELGRVKGILSKWAKAEHHPLTALVHADPVNPQTQLLLEGFSTASDGYLVGGLTYSPEKRGADFKGHLADKAVAGGLSGLLLAPGVPLAVGVTQGVVTLGDWHEITDGEGNHILRLDGRPATDVLEEEAGDVQAALGFVHLAVPDAGLDTGAYVVQNLGGIDPVRARLTASFMAEPGLRVRFVRRDTKAAEEDLLRMIADLRRRLGGAPKGVVMISCIARGAALFGSPNREMELAAKALGGCPMVGFLAGGEILRNRLQSHSTVMLAFG